VAGRSIGWPAGFWLTLCAGLAAAVAYQLVHSFPLAPTVTAAPPTAAPLELAERPPLPRTPGDDAIADIAARPLFSESRRPYAPPPEQVEEVIPEPPKPSVPLELAGTFLTSTDQAALLQVSGGTPEWLRQGQLIEGWRIERIEQHQVSLRKADQEQVLRLREDIAVLKSAAPAPARRRGEAGNLREIAEPSNDDDALQYDAPGVDDDPVEDQ
jgi:hypothetical protein